MINIKEISEHCVCLDLLPKKANILDAGCRGFLFTDEMKLMGHNVYSVDCDDLPQTNYFKYALSHKQEPYSIVRTNDPQATHIELNSISQDLTHTIESFSKAVNVKRWDLIKLDIEGAEFAILKTANHPIAKQVSVEFHAHCVEYQTKETIDNLLNHLKQWYDVYNDVWESKHGAGFNYWSVLLIAK